MAYLALSNTDGDMILSSGGGVERVVDGRFVIQQVRSKLRTFLGEWALNPNVGWLRLDDFERGFDRFGIEDRARKIILKTQGVQSIISLEALYDQRKLTLIFSAKTIYGEISLTVPWS